eukprot:scaffold55240_cov58-Phaeocystis_antarctica.AAC.1
MQRGGELAGLEGVVLLWGTERTYVITAPSRGRRSNDSGSRGGAACLGREPRVWRTSWGAMTLEAGKSPTATLRRAELPVP